MTEILRKFITQKTFPCACTELPTRCTDVSYVLDSEVIANGAKWLSIATRDGEFDHTNFVSYLRRVLLYKSVCDRCAVQFIDRAEFQEVCHESEKLGLGKVKRFVQSQLFTEAEAFRLMSNPSEIFDLFSGPNAHRDLTSLLRTCHELAYNVVVACHQYDSEYSEEKLAVLFHEIMNKTVSVEDVLAHPIYQLTLDNMTIEIGQRR